MFIWLLKLKCMHTFTTCIYTNFEDASVCPTFISRTSGLFYLDGMCIAHMQPEEIKCSINFHYYPHHLPPCRKVRMHLKFFSLPKSLF